MIEQRVNLIIEYIEQILSDNLKIKGTMSINSEEINGVKYKTLNISVPQRNFERHVEEYGGIDEKVNQAAKTTDMSDFKKST